MTVQDVVEKANPKKFNLIAQSLAGDCVALAPTAGADDLLGVEAAANAVYRSVAGGSNNPAGVRRVEQGLRRLAAALDKTSPVRSARRLTHDTTRARARAAFVAKKNPTKPPPPPPKNRCESNRTFKGSVHSNG